MKVIYKIWHGVVCILMNQYGYHGRTKWGKQSPVCNQEMVVVWAGQQQTRWRWMENSKYCGSYDRENLQTYQIGEEKQERNKQNVWAEHGVSIRLRLLKTRLREREMGKVVPKVPTRLSHNCSKCYSMCPTLSKIKVLINPLSCHDGN